MNSNNKLPIQIDDLLFKLNEDQLRVLNRKVVERLKLIDRAKGVMSVAKFNILDRVYFRHNGRKMIGTVVRLNQRSVSVNLDDGQRWKVDAGLLKKIIER